MKKYNIHPFLSKHWLFLAFSLIIYLILGGFTFSTIEEPYAKQICSKARTALDDNIDRYVERFFNFEKGDVKDGKNLSFWGSSNFFIGQKRQV